MNLPHRARLTVVAIAAVLLAGCAAQATPLPPTSSGAVPTPDETSQAATPPAPTAAPSVTTRQMSNGILTDFYEPNLMAVLRVPPTPGPTPLAVVVPGGGWQTSDPVDYRPLAESLTASGVSTSLITYSTTADGATFPRPIDDVACAVRWSAFQLNALGYPPSQIYLIGHSAGGQLVMEVALTGDRFGSACPYPPVTITGVAGVAGVYDLASSTAPAAIFSGGGTPEERAEFSPITAAKDPGTSIPPFRVMILSGANDVIVPAEQPQQLADALRARGIDPETQVLPLEHNMGFPLALEIAPIIAQWILGDAYVPSPTASAEVPAPPASPAPDPATVAPSASPVPPASPVPAAS